MEIAKNLVRTVLQSSSKFWGLATGLQHLKFIYAIKDNAQKSIKTFFKTKQVRIVYNTTGPSQGKSNLATTFCVHF